MNDTDTPATLLFVDDEPGILSSLRRLFRPQGYRILTAESGAAGLALLREQAVDLIISDMRMPEMDGATFLRHVRDEWPDIVRILLTGYADITSTIAAINEGEIYRYIAKPWDDNEIVLTVREAVDRRRLEQENRRLQTLTSEQNEALRTLNASLEQKVAERTAELRSALATVEKTHAELKKSFLTTVQVFAGLMELRSTPAASGRQLAGHGKRVAELARALAQRLRLPDAEVQTIMLAGLLHDVGKIGLPDELLDKPFNLLTGEQRTLVMKHALTGQNLLMGIERFHEVAVLVRHHHELFDGSGFPDRLAGIAIPQGARILSVANDYDALQLGTLVQRPLGAGEALAYLIDNRGKRYDPQIVDALAVHLAETQKSPLRETPLRTLHLKPGMVLARDLHHRDGYLLLARGSVLSPDIIHQLLRMEQSEQQPITLYIRQEDA